MTNMARPVIQKMTAYTLEPREAQHKLDQNESPFDLPDELKKAIIERVSARSWNLYPDFETTRLRAALAARTGRSIDEVLAGNGSNELLLATLTTFIGPGTPVILPSPTFALYQKIATVQGGVVEVIPIDPASGRLPIPEVLGAIAASPVPPVVILCSPNNPTGGFLRDGELESVLATGAMVIHDRAYGDFRLDELPPAQSNLVTLSTFSKAWGIAGLRVGWLLSTAGNCREIRKVKLPYNLNIFSEEAASLLLENPQSRDACVAHVASERQRVTDAMKGIDGVTPYPSAANFIAFAVDGDVRRTLDALFAAGVLVRDISAYRGLENALRVSIGTTAQNDRFLAALQTAVSTKESR